MTRFTILSILACLAAACSAAACAGEPTDAGFGDGPVPETADPAASTTLPTAAAAGAGLVVRLIPEEDPGPPFYARVGYQFFRSDGWLVIPFYREPGCIPAGFNLLDFFHFPGPDSPGAFACPVLMTGRLLIEPHAAPGTFPRQVVLEGAGIPIWFVDSAAFDRAATDGAVAIGDLESLAPLIGTATRYHETLHPREGEHKIIIDAAGDLEDGRRFQFHAAHVRDELRSIRVRLY